VRVLVLLKDAKKERPERTRRIEATCRRKGDQKGHAKARAGREPDRIKKPCSCGRFGNRGDGHPQRAAKIQKPGIPKIAEARKGRVPPLGDLKKRSCGVLKVGAVLRGHISRGEKLKKKKSPERTVPGQARSAQTAGRNRQSKAELEGRLRLGGGKKG